jgi:hypothetical protein
MGSQTSKDTNEGSTENKAEDYFRYNEAESHEVSWRQGQSESQKNNQEIIDEKTLKASFLLIEIARRR